MSLGDGVGGRVIRLRGEMVNREERWEEIFLTFDVKCVS
jgi:hypothetical protein